MPRGRSPSPRGRNRSPSHYGGGYAAPAPKAPDGLRAIVFQLGRALIVDIVIELTLAVFTLLLLPTWRIGNVISIYKRRARRAELPSQFANLLVDVFAGIPSAVLITATVYRIPKVIAGWATLQRTLIEQAGLVLKDVSAVLCAALVYATLWRIRYLRDLQTRLGVSPFWDWRIVYWFQALHLVCDLFVLPIAPLLLLGPWRLRDLWNDNFAALPSTLVSYHNPTAYGRIYARQRVAIVRTLGEILLDYLCFAVVLLIVVTVVRVPTLWRAIKHRKDEKETFRDSFMRTFKEELSLESSTATKAAHSHTASVSSVAAPANADVEARIAAARTSLSGQTQAALKAMLRRNDQAFSGLTTKELIDRVADQVVRGRIPRCPQCFAGKLRFANGRYTCPGYMDDEAHFHRCSFTAMEGGLTREAWLP